MKTVAICIWLAYVLAANAMVVASAIQIESIIATGPTLTVTGLILAYATRTLRSRNVLYFALSGPLTCAAIALSIAVFELGPESAQRPVTVMLVCYVVLFWPAAIFALKQIVKWSAAVARPPGWMQFSLKTLLIAMTAVCLLIVAIRQFADHLRPGEWIFFGGFALGVILACAVIVWRQHVVRAATNAHFTPAKEQPADARMVDIERAP
jgi:hypothetical protein